MANLILQQNNDGLEFHIDTETSQAYASIRATARMVGVSETAIRKWIGANQIKVKTAEIHTPSGLQGANLLTSESVFEAALKYCPELARKMGACGANVFMLGLSGYQVQAIAPAQPVLPQTYLEALKALVAATEREEAALAQLEAAKPAIEFVEAIAVSDESIDFNEFAKLVGTGRTRLFRAMRKAGVILQQSNLPYQKWMDAGYFEVTEIVGPNGVNVYALVTGKGQLWLQQRLGIHGKNTTFVDQLDLLEE
jgi:phage antirepressor YoqD-like protein